MEFIKKLTKDKEDRLITEKEFRNFTELYESYCSAMQRDGFGMSEHAPLFFTLLERVKEQIATPVTFEPFHQKCTSPFNYYRFGIDFIRPLVDLEGSKILHSENLEKMNRQIEAKENVILFANHQTEVDPQLISIILEEKFEKLASEMIFVAGDRVISDPMAVPFSLGRNLLCIHSKRHIDNPPEQRAAKQLHNQKTMHRMRELLEEGGKSIYVAPSGGRDRANEKGEIEVADFDPQSIEMFRLMAKKAKTPTHFYPLSLVTYDILPPPQAVQSELGEKRTTSRNKILMSFGNELDMENCSEDHSSDRHTKRLHRAAHILGLVKEQYRKLKEQ